MIAALGNFSRAPASISRPDTRAAIPGLTFHAGPCGPFLLLARWEWEAAASPKSCGRPALVVSPGRKATRAAGSARNQGIYVIDIAAVSIVPDIMFM
ncbi:MAG: hypothetical protein KGJ46_10905 [Xanthomonadaceae bacterium]|nr:hypothetical protein [Xanthomonadaceae bacterium]MDE2225770.1 hypothetical protein [Xanthomonadaceae bacterium]